MDEEEAIDLLRDVILYRPYEQTAYTFDSPPASQNLKSFARCKRLCCHVTRSKFSHTQIDEMSEPRKLELEAYETAVKLLDRNKPARPLNEKSKTILHRAIEVLIADGMTDVDLIASFALNRMRQWDR